MQDKTEGVFFMQLLRTSSAGSDSPPSGLSCIRASSTRYLWHYFFHFCPLVQTLERGPTFGSPWSSSTPPFFGRGRVAPPPPSLFLSLFLFTSHLLILLLLLASGNVYSNPSTTPVCPRNPKYLAPYAPMRLGESLSSVAAAKGGSTLSASGSLNPL